MSTFRTILTAVVITASVLLGSFVARATTTEPLKYDARNGNGPTLVIRGTGCLQAEDSTTLRLVDYDPTHNRIVYRCLVP